MDCLRASPVRSSQRALRHQDSCDRASSRWSDLPQDLLHYILSTHLPCTHLPSTRVVCRTWCAVSDSIVLKLRIELAVDTKWSARIKRLVSFFQRAADSPPSAYDLQRFPNLTKLALAPKRPARGMVNGEEMLQVLTNYLAPAGHALTHITTLYLPNWGISSIPSSLFDMTWLVSLDLSRNNLSTWLTTTMTTHAPSMKSLIFINVSYCYLTEVSLRALCGFSRLRGLDASHNCIKVVPDAISQLTCLKELDLSHNHLTGLPSSIMRLHKLRKLQLSTQCVHEMWPSVLPLSTLRSLHDLRLKSIKLQVSHAYPALACISVVTHLRRLELKNNQLSPHELPDYFSRLVKLERLRYSGNKLRGVPACLSCLTGLKVLQLQRNELRTLPSTLTRLSRLELLNISSNGLSSLPPVVTMLSTLKILSAKGNEFVVISEDELTSLTCLASLDLRYNPDLEPQSRAMLITLFKKRNAKLQIDSPALQMPVNNVIIV